MCFVPSHEGLESKAEWASAFLTYPGSTMAVDWHGLYGSTAHIQCHDYLLVMINCFTLEVHLIPMTTWVTTKEVAWLFLKEIV